MRIVIIGAGTYGEVYLSYLREKDCYQVVGFLDDNPALHNQIIGGQPVLGTSADFSKLKDLGVQGVFAPLGDNRVRLKLLHEARAKGFATPGFIHHSVEISPDTRVGDGVYILAGSIVMPFAVLSEFSMVSMGVNIAHHTTLGRGTFVSTGCNVGACIDIGEGAFIGIGATLMTGIKRVGQYSTVGAGAVVIRDVDDFAVVAGVPARVLEKRA